MIEQYLDEFTRWTAGGETRRKQLRDELQAHLRAAEQAGELKETMERMGTAREAAKTFGRGYAPPPAHLGKRIAAFLIDVVSTAALAVGAVGLGTWAFGTSDASHQAWPIVAMVIPVVVLAVAWWPIVLTLAEWRFGKTLGKALMGLEVITEDGTAPSFGQVVLRRLTLVFSGPLQILDWGFALFNDRRQRALDRLARTVVVSAAPPAPVPGVASGSSLPPTTRGVARSS